jgi:CelD/BcsL family acetyltransferase involved in cellulose biosynthesis
LLDGLFEECHAIDVIRFPYSSARLTTSRRWIWTSERQTPVLVVRIAGDFASYLRRTLRKKRRDNVRRERAILEQVAETPLRLRCITAAGDVGPFLDEAETVFARSWHAERGANRLRKDRHSEDRLRWQAERGWLRCYVLSKGDEPIAFLLGLQCQRVFRALRTAFSASWAQYSPGKVLWFGVLEDLHESGAFDELNFGYGDWEYKRIMATDGYTVSTHEAIRPGVRNALIWSGPVLYATLRAAAVAALTRLNLRDRAERWSRKRLAR